MSRGKRGLEGNEEDQSERKRPALARYNIYSFIYFWIPGLITEYSHMWCLRLGGDRRG